MSHTIKAIILPLCLCLLLAACGRAGAPTATQPPEEAPAHWEPETIPAIAGEESAPPEVPAGETDGMEGSYYNDFLRETLILDGYGGCSLSWPGGVMGGSYRCPDGGDLLILISENLLTARPDSYGDLTVEGKQGRFLRDWAFWGITPAEAGIHPVNTLPDTEEVALGGGAYRYRDFGAHLALTYDEALQILAGRLGGAVTVADGKGGFVVGRNVTERWLTRSGDVREFMEDYLREEVFSDCASLCGAVGGYDDMTIFAGGEAAGRLGAGEVRLAVAAQEIAARVILYTSTYADGTENYICKCVLAPAENTAQLDALAAAVRDMGAARLVEVQ